MPKKETYSVVKDNLRVACIHHQGDLNSCWDYVRNASQMFGPGYYTILNPIAKKYYCDPSGSIKPKLLIDFREMSEETNLIIM